MLLTRKIIFITERTPKHALSILYLWINTCIIPLVGVTHAFGPVVRHVWGKKLKNQVMAKHLLKQFKDLQVWSFLKTVMHFLCFANRYSSLSNSLTLLLTSQAGGCVFASLCHCFCFCTSLFLPHLTMKPLAGTTTVLRMINLCRCTQLCVKRVF